MLISETIDQQQQYRIKAKRRAFLLPSTPFFSAFRQKADPTLSPGTPWLLVSHARHSRDCAPLYEGTFGQSQIYPEFGMWIVSRRQGGWLWKYC